MRKLEALKSITAHLGMLSLLVLSGASYANTPTSNTLSNTPAQSPLFTTTSSTPLNMLVMGRDHKLYFEAYNDASDLNGDGTLDIGYKGYLSRENGGIDYFGYFNSHLCYTYNTANGGYFQPALKTTDKRCSGSTHWSGDYLNYLTTSRMDALRKVLYGGQRDVDTASQTILRGAYITQDAHTWGKEVNRNEFTISDFAPLNNPNNNSRHLLSVTSTADNAIPKLQVIQNSSFRIWDWVSKERPVAGSQCGSNNAGCGTIAQYNIRVEVCPSNATLRDATDTSCKIYPSGAIKPVGVLHDFGETDRMHFGLLTGSYTKNISGGTLRSNIASFAREVDPSNGRFCINTDACTNTAQLANPIRNGIVDNINKLRMTGFHFSTAPTGNLSNGNNYSWTRCPWIANREMNQSDECHMWGNPIGEMMYETLRYFSGATGATSIYDYTDTGSVDKSLGLAKPAWVAPYSANNYPSCSVPAMTVISDINPSFDNKLPGSQWSPLTNNVAALSGLNVSTETNAIGVAENITGNYFIGESNGTYDGAPSSKAITELARARGLSPEEPTRQGTYYSAGIAKYAAENAIGGSRKLHTYAVALASPLPEINFKIGNSNITVVPFAKTAGGGFGNFNVDYNSSFRPTNSIADYYVEEIANTEPSNSDATINGGRPYMKFRINFEDQEQGADFDTDALVTYTLSQTADNKLSVKLDKNYGGTSWIQNIGYVISGTGPTTDGVYLDICLSSDSNCRSANSYLSLNTPPGQNAGYCVGRSTVSACRTLPQATSTRTFTPVNNTQGAGLLENPLWYAAKYGIPGRDTTKISGDPDNYFLVTNALNLKAQLTNAFNNFEQANTSISSPAISLTGNEVEDGLNIYRTDYKARTWSGDLIKESLDLTTGKRTTQWKASSAINATNRSIKISNSAGTALQDLTWENLANRQAYNNAGTSVNLQSALAQNHSTNTLAPVTNGQLSSADNTLGIKRLNFIKGGTDIDIRQRDSILGDIINSNPVVVGGAMYLNYLANNLEPSADYAEFAASVKNRAKRIYVGANDGMLHGFSDAGAEAFAFMPTAVIPELHHLTKSTYNEAGGIHKYYVDGSPVVRDVFINGAWKTVLIGTLRGGGRSIFALDITNPTAVTLLWEFNFGADIAANAPANTPSDMGYSFPTPVVAKLHSGEWAVITGNGYDSPSGRAALMLIDIANGQLIKKIPTAESDTHNGLSTVRVADNNSDGVADYAYAGDLKGNVWRFDLVDTSLANPLARSTNVSANAYKVSFGGNPLYRAINNGNTLQPITAAPSLVRHPSSEGYLVIFGTGRYFRDEDKNDPENAIRQSIYGVWDKYTTGQATTTSNAPSLTRADLQQQTMASETVSHTVNGATVSQTARVLSQTPVVWRQTGTTTGKMGWYLDLGAATPDGERLVNEMAARGQVLFAGTMVPANNPCEPGITGWMYGIDPFTGGRANFAAFDFNRDGVVNANDNYDSKTLSGFKIPAGGFTLSSDRLFSTDGESRAINFGPTASGRQSWQIIPEDE